MSLLTPQKVRYIFEGQAWRARLEQPNFRLRECDFIAEEIVDAGGRPTDWANPLGLAIGLKYKPVPGPVPNSGGDLCDGHHIFYKPSPDPRQQGLCILHPIVHNWTMKRYRSANEAACWLITGALAVLYKYRLWTVDQVMVEQKHVPRWLIEARLFTLWEKREAAE